MDPHPFTLDQHARELAYAVRVLPKERVGGIMEQAVELAGCHRLAGPDAGKQPAFLQGCLCIVTRWARLPPLPQQVKRLRR